MEALAILFLTTFIEGLVEFLFAPFKQAEKYLGYVALVLGVGLAILYQVDIPAMVGVASQYPIVDYIVSGLIIGRGSNYVNDVITAVGNFTKK